MNITVLPCHPPEGIRLEIQYEDVYYDVILNYHELYPDKQATITVYNRNTGERETGVFDTYGIGLATIVDRVMQT